MFLPRFSGDGNLGSWIFQAELYFTYLGFDANDWLPLPSFYLEGEALAWFNSLFCNKLFLDWTHFKDKFAQRFRQQTNNDVLGLVVSPLPALDRVLKSSTSVLAFNTGSSQVDHVFDKLPVQYKYVESVALITKNNVEVEPLEDVDTPQIGNAKSVEANLEYEPSSIIKDQVFDEISHTSVCFNIHDLKAIVHEIEHSVPLAVLHDADGSYNDEKENSHDNVALFEKFPPLNTSDFSVTFACQGTVMSSGSSLLAEIDDSFVVALWLHTISCCHDSPEYRGVTKTDRRFSLTFTYANAIGLILGRSALFQSSRCLISVAFKTFNVLDFSLGGVTWLAPIMRPQTNGGDQLNSSQFPFDPGAKCVTVSIRLTATDLGVWNLRISFPFMARTGYTVNMEALQLQGCSGRCCLFAYSNSMTRVWDPGQSWCANSSILQSDSALAVALSSNYTHFYIVERSLSFYLTTLTSKVTGLTWRRNVLVFLLAWHAENKA
ncbi:hypothetical protein KY289_031172 [Solanum tuberosum]|nr:hypothetical protein KY289_031172 [Solanum tuberosum]